jgi:hypothetical protein
MELMSFEYKLQTCKIVIPGSTNTFLSSMKTSTFFGADAAFVACARIAGLAPNCNIRFESFELFANISLKRKIKLRVKQINTSG